MTLQIVLIAALMSCGCGILPPPVVPETPLPQPKGSTCETTDANLTKLGGCGLAPGFLRRCHADVESQAVVGAAPPLDCQTTAPTCDAFLVCR
jgi:hypothetical protein